MSKKKYTKLLAAAWCATTMASFYAAPVYAGDVIVSGITTGTGTTTITGSAIASAIGTETIPQLTVSKLILDGVTLDNAALSKAANFTVENTLTVGDQELTAAKIQGYDQAVIDVATNKSNITTLQADLVTAESNITALQGKTANLNADGSELTNMTKVAATTLEGTTITDGTATLTGGVLSGVSGITASGKVTASSIALGAQELTEAKIAGYDKTVTNTAGIERTSGGTNYTTIEGKVKVGNDGTVLINEGDTNQVKIDADGLHVGTTSTHMATDGVYAGGTDYAGAKAAIATDGRIKGAEGKFEVSADGSLKAADGNFTVDASGNAAVGGTLEVTGATTLKDKLTVTAGGAEINGDTTIKGALGAGANGTEFTVDDNGNVAADGGLKIGKSAGGEYQFTVDPTNGNIVSKGSITAASGQIGNVGITNTGVVTGVTSLEATTIKADALNVASFNTTGDMSIGGKLDVNGNINGAAITSNQFNSVILEGGNVSATDVNAANVNATGTVQGATIKADDHNILTSAGIKATAGTIGGVTLTGNKVSSADAAFTNVDAGKITLNDTFITDGSISDATGMNINGVNILGGNINTTGDVTAKNATLDSGFIVK